MRGIEFSFHVKWLRRERMSVSMFMFMIQLAREQLARLEFRVRRTRLHTRSGMDRTTRDRRTQLQKTFS